MLAESESSLKRVEARNSLNGIFASWARWTRGPVRCQSWNTAAAVPAPISQGAAQARWRRPKRREGQIDAEHRHQLLQELVILLSKLAIGHDRDIREFMAVSEMHMWLVVE